MFTDLNPKTLFYGDNLEVMQKLEPESIDLIATDPPYNTGALFKGTGDAENQQFLDRFEHDKTLLKQISKVSP